LISQIYYSNRILQNRTSYLCCKQESGQDRDSYLLGQDWSRTRKNLRLNTSGTWADHDGIGPMIFKKIANQD